jgi:hypothetical protein
MKTPCQFILDNPCQALIYFSMVGLSLVEISRNINKTDKFWAEYQNCLMNHKNLTDHERALTPDPVVVSNDANDDCVGECSESCQAASDAYCTVFLWVVGLLVANLLLCLPDVKVSLSATPLWEKAIELGLWKPKPEQKGLLNGDGDAGYGSDVVATVPEEVSKSEKDLEACYDDYVEDGVNQSLRYS